MKEAQEIWRKLPRQIASDLRQFFATHIRDWHQGKMSSRELLELFGAWIKATPDTGDVDPESRVLVRESGELSWRRYGDLALKGTREIIIDWAPDNGAVDKTVRDGGYNRVESMIAGTHNEIAWLRAHFVVANGGKDYEPHQLIDPRHEKLRGEELKAKAEFEKELDEDMFGGIEW